MEPVKIQSGAQVGSPITEKLLVTVRLKAFLTVAVIVGLALAQEGAVQVMRLLEAVFAAEPSEPVVAAHEKVSAEPSGSLAVTS